MNYIIRIGQAAALVCLPLIALTLSTPARANYTLFPVATNNTGQNAYDFHVEQTGGTSTITAITGGPQGLPKLGLWTPSAPGFSPLSLTDTSGLNPVLPGNRINYNLTVTGSTAVTWQYWWTDAVGNEIGNKISSTPEPSEIDVLAVGVGVLCLLVRRRKQSTESTQRTSADA